MIDSSTRANYEKDLLSKQHFDLHQKTWNWSQNSRSHLLRRGFPLLIYTMCCRNDAIAWGAWLSALQNQHACELDWNVNSQVPPQTCWITKSGNGGQQSVFQQALFRILMHARFENYWSLFVKGLRGKIINQYLGNIFKPHTSKPQPFRNAPLGHFIFCPKHTHIWTAAIMSRQYSWAHLLSVQGWSKQFRTFRQIPSHFFKLPNAEV